ncbi:MAG: efflux RND transporter permease subunit [Proteobacteria bacterium]|nr:efflux RND transporter permease subunit [Pseudomonadota bacterium]
MNRPGETNEKGIIAWFAANHVAANLLMVFIIVAGLISVFTIRKQTTPDFELNTIQVRVAYLGAAPQEVEEGVVVKVEEAIQDVKGIVKLSGRAVEGMGTVTAEVSSTADMNEVLNEIKTRVDAISTFPGLTERPVIYKQEIPIHVVFLAIHGALDEFSRKTIAHEVRDELMQLPDVSTVEFLGDRPYEISIEVSEHVLRQYGLTMSEVSQAVKNSSVDMPGGTIKSDGGDILLRTEGQVYTGHQFGALVLRTFPDGTRLTLNDIAEITDGFVETDGYGRFDGDRTATLRVLASEHGVIPKPLPESVLRRLKQLSLEVLEELAAEDDMVARVYASYREFQRNTSQWLEISEKAYFDARLLGSTGNYSP